MAAKTEICAAYLLWSIYKMRKENKLQIDTHSEITVLSLFEPTACGPQNPAHGGTKISGDHPCGLLAQGVTSDLATCGPVQDVLVQGILDKIHHWGLWLGVD